MRPKDNSQPLIEQIEGNEADDRAALYACWCRIRMALPRRDVTKGHVRSFVFFVWSKERHAAGVSLSYTDIGMELDCPDATARRVVDRATKEFGLVEKMEERFVTGGQNANRYRINWQMVRSINSGMIDLRGWKQSQRTRPAALSEQGPALSEQGPALSAHPLIGIPGIQPGIKPGTTTTATKNRIAPERSPVTEPVAIDGEEWVVVVDFLEVRKVHDVQGAVQAAKSRNLTATACVELISAFDAECERNGVKHDSVGYRLHRLLSGKATLEAATNVPTVSHVRSNSSTVQQRLDLELHRSKRFKALQREGFKLPEIEARLAVEMDELRETLPRPAYVQPKQNRTGVAPGDAATHKRRNLLAKQAMEVECLAEK